ncbi:unnamed protein product, partial [marine sediment metagenome]
KLGVVTVTSPLRAKKPNVTRLVSDVLKQLKDSGIEAVSPQTFASDMESADKLVKAFINNLLGNHVAIVKGNISFRQRP